MNTKSCENQYKYSLKTHFKFKSKRKFYQLCKRARVIDLVLVSPKSLPSSFRGDPQVLLDNPLVAKESPYGVCKAETVDLGVEFLRLRLRGNKGRDVELLLRQEPNEKLSLGGAE